MSYCAAEQGSLHRRHCVHQCDECRDQERAEEAAETCPDCLANPCKPACPSKVPGIAAKNADAVTAEQRLRPHQSRYPWSIVFVAGLLAVYGLAQAITDWGAPAKIAFKVERTCGI